ncbi:shikimate dehydrogenase [Ferrimonas gelatinilytica]|uniref:Shikimate dehydrogenase (NADP(+)) n=1 Tax=Ferrimonas gelatinilytica TaxID=1255257 RepID=A0ABP9SDZ8_9GAMM
MDKYAVIGHPIEHSKSPLIHSEFARLTGQPLEYHAILAPKAGFADAVKQFRQAGGKGANVTLPFKEEALALCDELSERARRAGAVNTLIWNDDERLLGDNTDGLGLVSDLKRHAYPLRDARILLLGAGGVARGVLLPLLSERPKRLVVANRTAHKAERLAADFSSFGPVTGVGLENLDGTFDLVINGTSASLSGKLPDLHRVKLAEDGCAYDMAYGDSLTPFQCWALENGARHALSGLGMLVGQAAESFALWRGVHPPIEPILELLQGEVE